MFYATIMPQQHYLYDASTSHQSARATASVRRACTAPTEPHQTAQRGARVTKNPHASCAAIAWTASAPQVPRLAVHVPHAPCPVNLMRDLECDDHVDCGTDRYCAHGISTSGQLIRKCSKLVYCEERRDAVNTQCPCMPARTNLPERLVVGYVVVFSCVLCKAVRRCG